MKVIGNWEHKTLLCVWKTLTGWGFQLLFPPSGTGMRRRTEEDLSCKGNTSRSRKAGRSRLRQQAWPLIVSHITKRLCFSTSTFSLTNFPNQQTQQSVARYMKP